MDFEYSDRVKDIKGSLESFMAAHIYPNEDLAEAQIAEGDRWQPLPVMDELKQKAKADGLWNLFLHDEELGAGLSNVEYATLCEVMGRSPIAPEVFNCSAPDTGNMETLSLYGDDAQKTAWLTPLLAGEIRSAFVMTEPDVASSDARNIQSRIVRDGDDYVLNGHKWWISRGR